ncbi:MAG: primosomal protein N' [Deltaproteobacteria bacterium]
MTEIAEIIINNSSRQLSRVFHYKIPENMTSEIKVGHIVNVPFGKGNKNTRGYVVGFVNNSPFEELKYINEIVLKDELIIKNELILLAVWMSNEYMCSISDCIKQMLPPSGQTKLSKDKKDKNPLKDKNIERTIPFVANEQQKAVIERISASINSGEPEKFLIHGVTGSGKTEVYLQLISQVIEQDRQAIVLVPEISLTPQMIHRFVGRFGEQVAVLHSRLSDGERKDQWYKIKEGRVKVVVGARSAIFAPFQNLGMIIIDEEHEHTYKSEKTPRFHAKDIAYKRSKLESCTVVLGSATPAIETYYQALNGKIILLKMSKRANEMELPTVKIIDMREEMNQGNRSIFSKVLYDAIMSNLENKTQTILFLNRRGYSSFVLCRNCGYVPRCSNCSISLTYHIKGERLICHYCGHTRANIHLCPKCQSKHIRHFGAGTQRVEDEIKNTFPAASILRMDMDTTSKKNAHEEILNKFRNEKVDILIGTQMIAKGHDFPDVTLVGVISADIMLNLEDFRSTEKTFQLLTQVAGRAGRAKKQGRVIIQTYEIDNFSIQTAKTQNYEEFYRQEIILREQLKYPPFCDIVSIMISGKELEKVKQYSKELEEKIRRALPESREDTEFYCTVPAPVSKINNRYRWRIILKCNIDEEIRKILKEVTEKIQADCAKWCTIGVDVNPVSFM